MKYYTVDADHADSPLEVRGLLGDFHRLPDGLRAVASDSVRRQSLYPIGGRVRFATDAGEINVKIHINGENIRCAADAYADGKRAAFHIHDDADVPSGARGVCEFTFSPQGDSTHLIEINLPRNTDVTRVTVGITEGCEMRAAAPYKIDKPIVFYGSSLTAGSNSREPGHTYEARLSRLLDADYINLGFGGAALGEIEIARYIASLDMSAFVMDYTSNAPDAEFLARTHKPFFDTVRQAHPDMPILILSRPEFFCYDTEPPRDIKILSLLAVATQTYLDALRAGDERVWLLDGRLYYSPEEFTRYLADGRVHPNDTGFARYTQLIYPTLKAILHRCGFYPDEPVRVIERIDEE